MRFHIFRGHLLCVITVTGLDVNTVIPVREALQHGDIKKAAAHVTEDMVESFGISGTKKECKTKLKIYMSAGLKLPILSVGGSKVAIRRAIET